MANGNVGAWSPYYTVTTEDIVLFHTIQFPIGVSRIPVGVSKQVVAGINYRFVCTAHVLPNPKGTLELIEAIQKPGSITLSLKKISNLESRIS